MIEENDTGNRENIMRELLMLFSYLTYEEQEVIVEMAELMVQKKKDN